MKKLIIITFLLLLSCMVVVADAKLDSLHLYHIDSTKKATVDSTKKATLDSTYRSNTAIGFANTVMKEAHRSIDMKMKSVDDTISNIKWAFTILGIFASIAVALGIVQLFNIKERGNELLDKKLEEIETKKNELLATTEQSIKDLEEKLGKSVDTNLKEIEDKKNEFSIAMEKESQHLSSQIVNFEQKVKELEQFEKYFNNLKAKLDKDAEDMQTKVAEITSLSLDKKQGLTAEQKEILDKAAKNVDLKEMLGMELSASDYFNKAYDLHIDKKLEEAIKYYTKAIKINLKFSVAYNNRGNAYADLQKYDLAINDYTKAIEVNPKYDLAYNNRGFSYENLKEYDLAINDYTKAIEINPKLDTAYGNRGDIYFNLKEYNLAIADYTKVIELNPNNDKAYNNLAYVYFEIADFEKAIECFNWALKLNEKHTGSYCGLGITYFALENIPTAKSHYQKAIDLDQRFNGQFEELMKDGYFFSEKQLEVMQKIVDLLAED